MREVPAPAADPTLDRRLLLRSRETDRGTRRIAAQRTGGCGENPLSRSTRLENPAILGQRRAARDRSSDRRDLECHRETGPSPQPLSRRERGLSEELRSEEHTSELQSLMRISYAVFCL